tara:strand:+ start:10825 stop:11403 length:579 start_codon:yes stop_codon:yes gene_type:complete
MPTTSTVTAVLSSDIAYSFIDSVAGSTVNETSSLGYTLSMSAGTGTGQINAAVRYTGYLPSGGQLGLSFTGFPKTILGGTYSLNFTDVKGIVVENQWNGTGSDVIGGTGGVTETRDIAYLTVYAPDTSGFTGLFNGSNGAVRVNPACTWMFNDRFGVSSSTAMLGTTNDALVLEDTSGSGVPVSVIAVGVTG